MKIKVIAFSAKGALLCKKIVNELPYATGYAPEKYSDGEKLISLGTQSVYKWTESCFEEHIDGIVFVGAAGICVRSIAPFIKSKQDDPAVVVVDELASYSISILSGHMGGANSLAKEIADVTGAKAVITTATDINNVFAVDSWAKENRYHIYNTENIKKISSALLNYEQVGLISDFPVSGNLPKGLEIGDKFKNGIYIGDNDKLKPYENTLILMPKRFFLGIGCRKNISSDVLESRVLKFLNINNIKIEQIGAIGSIDIKKEETALLSLAEKYKIPLSFFSADQLKGAKGEFLSSAFVMGVTGVDNVCERSAMLLGDNLVVEKTVGEGTAIAVSKKEWKVNFENSNGGNRL